ncbi:hypothetical protein JD79_03594 [Geodermatophilus normandii]|uniref:Uncharacterized protein n=1 Tax=Geodermatophilus normandii TaxID=1137989 RepID=A0A317QQG8_9ACTN|nr:hypothetical protein [Geodermatophilus normandii]PWW24415.1 hypothetical protein JD79_03594 [Geodermatophilus normandii]
MRTVVRTSITIAAGAGLFLAGTGVSSAVPEPGGCPPSQRLMTEDDLVAYGVDVIGLSLGESQEQVDLILSAVDRNGDRTVCFSTSNKNFAPHGRSNDNNANVGNAAR